MILGIPGGEGMKKLILGLGNPLLADDGIGPKVALSLKEHLSDFNFEETSYSSLNLVDILRGYDLCFILDAYLANSGYGEVKILEASQLRDIKGYSSSHDMDLYSALELGKAMGYHLPRIVVLGIGVKCVNEYSENLSPEIAEKFQDIVGKCKNIILGHIWKERANRRRK